MADTTFKTGFTSTFSLLLLILSFSFRNYSCWSYWSYIVGVLVKKYVLDTKNKKIRSGFLLLLLILLPEIYSGFELGEKSRLTKTKNPSEGKREKNLAAGNFFFFFFWVLRMNEHIYFFVHTVINKMFFRCKVCLQAYIFIDANAQQNVCKGRSRMS